MNIRFTFYITISFGKWWKIQLSLPWKKAHHRLQYVNTTWGVGWHKPTPCLGFVEEWCWGWFILEHTWLTAEGQKRSDALDKEFDDEFNRKENEM